MVLVQARQVLRRHYTPRPLSRCFCACRRRQATMSGQQSQSVSSTQHAPVTYPTPATSQFLKGSSQEALSVEGIEWMEEVEDERERCSGRRGGGGGEVEQGLSQHDQDDLGVVERKRSVVLNKSGDERGTKKMNMYQAIRDAMSISMTKDDSAVVFGEDVAFGGVFRCTMGLAEEFGPSRVFNTPLTEQGIAGFGIGLAAMGHTAIAEIQFADYIFPAFDQLVNEAAKFRYRSGGQYNVGSLTVRAPSMAVGHGALYHSQSPEAFFQQAAGLKVVIPRSPIQAKGLLLSSIRERNPIIFLEPKTLYRTSVEQVPLADFHLPLGQAEILQSGNDLTLISYGTPIYTCETALAMLRHPPQEIEHLVPQSLRQLKVELIDLRTVVPIDAECIRKSVNKTGRCVVVHEAARTGGIGAEVAAIVQSGCFTRLEAPVKRVTGWDTPFPLYEKHYVPDVIRILDAIIETASF